MPSMLRDDFILSAETFLRLLPKRPYCSQELTCGTKIRPCEKAAEFKHVQFNGPHSFRWITLDVDDPESYYADRDANLPPANLVMTNPANGHGHLVYLLRNAVARHSNARIAPLHHYAAVERGLVRRTNADRHYRGLLAKNPLHPAWRVYWRRGGPYSLGEIRDYLFDHDVRPHLAPDEAFGAGRNCIVFDHLRVASYRSVLEFKMGLRSYEDWFVWCLEQARKINSQFPRPLGPSEIRSIARSIARWTWRKFSPEEFAMLQASRGKRGAEKRWKSHSSAEKFKPWDAEGISRATYYRRRAKLRSTSTCGSWLR